MKKLTLIFVFILLGALNYSCKKNGTGGSASIVVFPTYLTKPINGNMTVYVKFGATTEPSDPTTNYNLKISNQPKMKNVSIDGLLYGNYYVYVAGYDSTAGNAVVGGRAITINWDQRQQEMDIAVPVL